MKFMRMLGVAMMAALALTAIAASAAHAEKSFTASTNPVSITGVQEAGNEHVFTVEGSPVECATAHFTANNVASPSATLTVNANYANCTAFGFANAHVTMNTCHYEFQTPAGPVGGPFTGKVAMRCGATPATVRVTAPFTECHVDIGEANNTSLGTITYTNLAGGKVKVGANVTGITVNKTKDVGLCPLSGTGHTNTGKYTGNTIVEGLAGICIDVG
jgi:hypothetical protein